MAGENIESQWTAKGFNDRFDEVMREHGDNADFTYVRCYEIVEQEHVAKFGSVRYKNYESFRVSRRSLIFGN